MNLIKFHSIDDFEGMRRAGAIARQCLDVITPYVQPGTVTEKIDDLAREFILDNNAIPACLGYRGYSKTLCISVNHVVCHGIPGTKILQEGDIANIDVTVIVDGWHGDTSRMFPIGKISPKAQKLINVTQECMDLGILAVKPGATTNDIGRAIQEHAHKHHMSVVTTFCGHGIGKVFHDEPQILHYYHPHIEYPLKPGMFFTIEPMINLGKPDTKFLNDGWTAVTRDKSLSAQCEHSIGVTEFGFEIFT